MRAALVEGHSSDPIERTAAVASSIGHFTPDPDGRLHGTAVSSPAAQAESKE